MTSLSHLAAPLDPVAAVTHVDPYAYYHELAMTRPWHRDERLGCWVACDAETVTAVLSSELCRVRPVGEPVPRALLGSAAADIFRHLVRMTDGDGHCPLKRAVSATLDSLIEQRIAETAAAWAERLADDCTRDAQNGGGDVLSDRLSAFSFRLPAFVVASLLGVQPERLPQIANWMHDFARCIAPGATHDEIARGVKAAAPLLALFRDMAAGRHLDSDAVVDKQPRPDVTLSADEGGLSMRLARELRAGIDTTRPADATGAEATAANPIGADASAADVALDDAIADLIAANAIGFMSQAYEATAGLIGNTIVALASRPELRSRPRNVPSRPPAASDDASAHLRAIVQEVLRYDPPVHNTRRFVAHDGTIAGQPVRAGDVILVVLAAANRDPAANPRPDDFDPFRERRRTFTFGAAQHACPGERLSTMIAEAGVRALLVRDLVPASLAAPPRYRPSVNTRIPIFWSFFSATPGAQS